MKCIMEEEARRPENTSMIPNAIVISYRKLCRAKKRIFFRGDGAQFFETDESCKRVKIRILEILGIIKKNGAVPTDIDQSPSPMSHFEFIQWHLKQRDVVGFTRLGLFGVKKMQILIV